MTFSQGSWRAGPGSAVVRDPAYCNPSSEFPSSLGRDEYRVRGPSRTKGACAVNNAETAAGPAASTTIERDARASTPEKRPITTGCGYCRSKITKMGLTISMAILALLTRFMQEEEE